MIRTALLAALPLAFAGVSAFAEATDEGAEHLTEVFQTYLGTTEGVVTVAHDSDVYTVTLDATPLASMAEEAGGSASMTPLVMVLSDNGNGTWDVTQDQSLSLAFAAPGAVEVTVSVESFTSRGVFDEALMTFTSSTSDMSKLSLKEKITDPNSGEMVVNASVASATYETTGIPNSAGGVDSTFTMELLGLSEDFVTPESDGMPAMSITLTAASMTQTGSVNGLRPDAMYQLLAWFIAHPTPEAMEADKATVKSILLEGLPIFAGMTSTSVAREVSISTPFGGVGIAELGFDVDLNGLVEDGLFREAFSVKGLTLPVEMIPVWAVPILPKDVSLDFQVTDFDAAAAANLAIGLLDLPAGTEPDPGFDAAMLAALLPEGKVTVGLNPGGISGDGYALTYEGSMVAGPDLEIPTGSAKITLAGIEVLQAALAAAPPEIQGQAMMGIGMAQGMAAPGPNGELVWEIDASTPGSLSINGMPMMP